MNINPGSQLPNVFNAIEPDAPGLYFFTDADGGPTLYRVFLDDGELYCSPSHGRYHWPLCMLRSSSARWTTLDGHDLVTIHPPSPAE